MHNKVNPIYFRNLSTYDRILHFISTRQGGVSLNGQSSLNLSFSQETDAEKVLENRKRLAGKAGFDLSCLTLAQQQHTCNVALVTTREKGSGAFSNTGRLVETDAMITRTPGICLMVMTADCVPVLLFDPVENVIAAIHAGWRGTVKRIVSETLSAMSKNFGCKPENILAGIGPSIGVCCYEVGIEVVTEVREVFDHPRDFLPEHEGKPHFDLRSANRYILEKEGVLSGHIETIDLCTSCFPELFFSHRGQKANTGRMGAGIMLKE